MSRSNVEGNAATLAPLLGRLALAASFFSAVADRFGAYGPPGAPKVAWGDFAHFTAYTALLTPFAPASLVPVLAWAATIAEAALATLLVLGLFTRAAAGASALLLTTFAVAMTTSLGIKAPLDYSVWTAAAAALLIWRVGPGPWSLDARRRRT